MNFPIRLPLMALAVATLALATWAGLIRLGWPLPLLRPSLPMSHGPLMIAGFLGTLISLERAIALRQGWGYIAPALTVAGGFLLLVDGHSPLGPLLISLGSFFLLLILAVLSRRHFALYTAVLLLGAAVWLVGNLLWLAGRPVHQVVLWWLVFLVLTIAGERLELSRILKLSRTKQLTFVTAGGLLMAGLILSLWQPDLGARLSGAGLLALALWLLLGDVARRTIRYTGLTRYMAVCLLIGYAWLGAGGVLALVYGGLSAGPRYDAFLHAIFLGFVFSMIFGHAPIIFPTITGRPFAYRPTFYIHLVLLHLSLLLRVGSDLIGWLPGRQWGGMLNALVLLLFLVNTVWAIARPGRLNVATQKSLRRD